MTHARANIHPHIIYSRCFTLTPWIAILRTVGQSSGGTRTQIAELDFNPVKVMPKGEGYWIVDASVVFL